MQYDFTTIAVWYYGSRVSRFQQFLYVPFPLESRLSERMCENVNAEIASGTVSLVGDAVGYLGWTYYAKRMRSNPSYYGAESGSDEDVDFALLSVVKDTLLQLKESGCIEYDEQDAAGSILPTSLGIASCSYYLLHETPKQMQFGVTECRKLILNELTSQEALPTSSDLESFTRIAKIDEISLAWLLYTLCNTHEFDELPVRHNEEILNEELASDVRWGADTQGLLTGNQGYHGPDIYADPHTKAFLLIQAYLEGVRLPISDYVNDTKSVVENIPRLLAAMEYIASSNRTAAGSFELLTQFVRVRQCFETRSLPDENPLQQIGFPAQVVKILSSGANGKKDAVRNVHQLRSLNRNDALTVLNKVNRAKGAKMTIDAALDRLYAVPLLKSVDSKVTTEVDKATGMMRGKLKLSMEIERTSDKKMLGRSRSEVSLTVLVGSLRQGMLLSKAQIRLAREGKWSVSKELGFDWNTANADGGEDGGSLWVRFLFNEVRGFDQQLRVPLR